MRKIFVFIAIAISSLAGNDLFGKTVYDTLFITRGYLENYEDNTLPAFNFNATNQYEVSPYVININLGDDLSLIIANRDVAVHQVRLQGKGIDLTVDVPANGFSQVIPLKFAGMNVIRVKDTNEQYHFQGLSTMIIFDDRAQSDDVFYWNLREIHVGLMRDYPANQTAAFADYKPEYFAVNNQSYPHMLTDTTAFVKGKVHDKLRIYMYNSGQMNHNFHFHGFHCTIKYSSNHPNWVGRSKDSVPIDVDQILVLEMNPHQPGVYLTHNHNLGTNVGTNQYPNVLGVTICGSARTTAGNNIYPYGMVTRIEITE